MTCNNDCRRLTCARHPLYMTCTWASCAFKVSQLSGVGLLLKHVVHTCSTSEWGYHKVSGQFTLHLTAKVKPEHISILGQVARLSGRVSWHLSMTDCVCVFVHATVPVAQPPPPPFFIICFGSLRLECISTG